MFLIDTDHLSLLQQGLDAANRIRERMVQHPQSRFYVSIVSFQEQAQGWLAYINSARKMADVVRGYELLRAIISDFSRANLLDLNLVAAERF